MRISVVHAHPVEQSYNSAVRDRVVAELRDAGHEVTVSLLGDGTKNGPDDLDGQRALLIICPIWWGGVPAQLLAWVQETLGPAIDQTPESAPPSPLSTVAHLVAVVTHGSSRLINQVEGEPAKHLLQRSLLPLCAEGASFDWVSLYKLDRLSPHQLTTFIGDAAARVVEITSG